MNKLPLTTTNKDCHVYTSLMMYISLVLLQVSIAIPCFIIIGTVFLRLVGVEVNHYISLLSTENFVAGILLPLTVGISIVAFASCVTLMVYLSYIWHCSD
jgi:hypothetical protein